MHSSVDTRRALRAVPAPALFILLAFALAAGVGYLLLGLGLSAVDAVAVAAAVPVTALCFLAAHLLLTRVRTAGPVQPEATMPADKGVAKELKALREALAKRDSDHAKALRELTDTFDSLRKELRGQRAYLQRRFRKLRTRLRDLAQLVAPSELESLPPMLDDEADTDRLTVEEIIAALDDATPAELDALLSAIIERSEQRVSG